MTRAAVVYLRHWQQTGDATSRAKAFDLLRAVAYFQTSSGTNAGNVVLWMQPDGTLNPSPVVHEEPDPSDSAESYWLARTVWALGEGYAAFRGSDPAFAGFLKNRLDLSVSALQRQTLARYGQFRNIDGEQTPAWLVVDGGDATAEAVLGLSAYVADRRGDTSGAGRTAEAGGRRGRPGWRRRAQLAVRCGAALGRCRARSGTAGARRCRRRSPVPRWPWVTRRWSRSPPGTPRSSTRGC